MRQEERRFVTYKIKQTLLNINTGLWILRLIGWKIHRIYTTELQFDKHNIFG